MDEPSFFVLSEMIEVIEYASNAHRFQRRKDVKGSAYIHHPIQVLRLLTKAGLKAYPVLAAAVLHDTIEDTGITYEQLRMDFGTCVADYVVECTDDKTLLKAARKQAQIDHAATLSYGAVLIKMADKICNLNDLCDYPPKWELTRIQEYIAWSTRVVDAMGANISKNLVDETYSSELSRSPSSVCYYSFLLSVWNRVLCKAKTMYDK